MTDDELKRWHEKFQVGDEVRHYGTRRWGRVTQVKPTRYGVELLVDPLDPDPDFDATPRYWEGIRIDGHRRKGFRACTCGAWNTCSRVHLEYCKATGPAPQGWPY